jgi:hypothetical protein
MNIVGIKVAAKINAAVVITSNAILASAGTFFGLLAPEIAVGQTIHATWWVPFSVGATGGVRAQLVTPAAVALFNCSITLHNTVAPSITDAMQVASVAFTNALANAGNHWLEVQAEVVNGVNAGTLDLQIAQNTVDVLSLTVLRGAWCDVTKA